MNFRDFEKASYLGWMIGNRLPDNQQNCEEMHCCDNCKIYEFNDGDCTGWGIDSAEDNNCSKFIPMT